MLQIEKKKSFHKTTRHFGHKMVLLIFLVTWACERYEPAHVGVDCDECYQQKPEWVKLNVKLTIDDQTSFVPLTVFVGDVEEGNVDWTDTAYSDDYWVEVKPDRYYSVKAKYQRGSDIIYVVDGDKVKLRTTDTDCDQTCYYKKGGYIDVRLRN